MKKNYIKIIAAVASVLLFACCQVSESDFGGKIGVVAENEVAFALGGVNTRSSVAVSNVSTPGAIIPLGSDETGRQFYLEESVIDLNSPVTRGTPAYTENVVALYDGELFAKSELGNDTYIYKESTGYYSKAYGKNIWDSAPDKKTLSFYMYMPVDITSYGVDADPTFGVANNKQTISFSYTSPTTAADQADIIFAARKIEKSVYEGTKDDNNNHYAEVLFHHALTGVKFAIGNDEDSKDEDGNTVAGDISKFGIKIKSVSFKNLYDSGDCVVTPTTEEGEYQDISDNYSSQATGTVVWDPNSLEASGQEITSGTFGSTLVTYTGGSFETEGYNYPTSFSQKGNEKNLNDGDATQTFWLIPQTIDKDNEVVLTVNYEVNEKEYSWKIDFGTALDGVIWKAGQLRTYTIRIDEVNVKIEDKVVTTQEDDKVLTDLSGNIVYDKDGNPYTYTYYGGTKSEVTITNTGNTDAFIRAALIGQWLDATGNPVFGFTDYTAGKVILVDSWYQDQFVTKARKHGSFTGLVGYDDNYSGSWVLGNDGYYYFTEIVEAGDPIPSDDPLFTSYSVDKNPAVAVAGAVKPVYFRLEISTQAISAKKSNGDSYTWDAAWKNALGYDPSI